MAGKKLVLVGGSVSLLTIIMVTVGFRTLGWTRFQENSRLQEGRSDVIYLARAEMACAEKSGTLPETSPKVPALLAQVGGKTFASKPGDWSDPSFKCEQFTIDDPQRFQYQWEKKGPTDGIARAQADFNGDGVVEATFEQQVHCGIRSGRFQCQPGAFLDRAK